ncbi:MAG: 2Fe-2S iron-sulfur cluster-binding protein, partial [Gammaproteobacteria bacterium]
MAEDAQITTIEGLGSPDRLLPLQQQFLDHDGFQCGYCTPGQVCSAVALLDEVKRHEASRLTAGDELAPGALSEDEIRERMSGNLCRCGAYDHIVEAIQEVAGTADSARGA